MIEDRVARTTSVMIPIAVAAAGFLAQVLWFSTQYGQQSAKLEQLDHRLAQIESNGSPALAGFKPQIDESVRRLGALESLVPTIQSETTQIEANSRRLDQIEHLVPDQIQKLFIDNALQTSGITRNTAEIERLRDWRVAQLETNAAMQRDIAVLQGRIAANPR
jgi:hypothetical protein